MDWAMTLNLDPAVVVWGSTSAGTVTLEAPAPAGATVTLASSDRNGTWTSIPPSVEVAAGARSATFQITTVQVYVPEQVTLTATYDGVTSSATLTVIRPTVDAVWCDPAAVFAGDPTVCTVTLTGPAPEDTPVTLANSDPSIAPTPPSLNIPAGSSRTAFTVATALVAAPSTVRLSAQAGGTAAVSATLKINLTNRGRRWVLNNVTFNDGGSAGGYFTFDEATGTYLDVNVVTTPAANGQGPWASTPASPYFFPEHLGMTGDPASHGSTSSWLVISNLFWDGVNPYAQEYSALILVFSQPLTNAGGTVALAVNPNAPVTPWCTYPQTCQVPPPGISFQRFDLPYYNPPAHWFRLITGGSVAAQ